MDNQVDVSTSEETLETTQNTVEETVTETDETQAVEVLDYQNFDLASLVAEFQKLTKEHPVQNIKVNADAIKSVFYQKYNAEVEALRQAHIAEHGSDLDFDFDNPIQKEFKNVWADYAKKRKAYFDNIEAGQKNNLSKKLAIIEEIKAMVESGDATQYNKFKELTDEFKALGVIPKDKVQSTWGNYHLQVERFYDLLHINKDVREADFKKNLEDKQLIVAKTKELSEQEDVLNAFDQLQTLHRIWKEETGPVSKEYREPIWEEFSKYTKIIRDKREAYYVNLREVEKQNLEAKNAVIEELKSFDFSNNQSHKDWKNSQDAFEKIKEKYFALGKVPKKNHNEIWEAFKEATAGFNNAKNAFYKDAKQTQNSNLEKKQALLEEAIAWKDSNDFAEATNKFKRLQADWKKVGHVPRKQADELWNQFREVCNAYFDRMNTVKKEGTPEENENLTKKQAYLEALPEISSTEGLNAALKEWAGLGVVPRNKQEVEKQFKKAILEKSKSLDLDADALDLMEFKIELLTLKATDERRLFKKIQDIKTEANDLTKEIKQLENNMSFVSGSKSNPLFAMVEKSITEKNQTLEGLKKKIMMTKNI